MLLEVSIFAETHWIWTIELESLMCVKDFVD